MSAFIHLQSFAAGRTGDVSVTTSTGVCFTHLVWKTLHSIRRLLHLQHSEITGWHGTITLVDGNYITAGINMVCGHDRPTADVHNLQCR